MVNVAILSFVYIYYFNDLGMGVQHYLGNKMRTKRLELLRDTLTPA